MCYRDKFLKRHLGPKDNKMQDNHSNGEFSCGYYVIRNSKSAKCTSIALLIIMFASLMKQSGQVLADVGMTKVSPLTRAFQMRSGKIAPVDSYQMLAASAKRKELAADKDAIYKAHASNVDSATAAKRIGGMYEIRSVAGEPNYKSVNLTWEVEFVTAARDVVSGGGGNSRSDNNENNEVASGGGGGGGGRVVTNSSTELEPPTAFQIFFCELQPFGPHRCRSKLVSDNNDVDNEDKQPLGENAGATVTSRSSPSNGNANGGQKETQEKSVGKNVLHYSAQIDNLRMATKYSFYIRPQMRRRNTKISARSEVFGNEIEPGNGGQLIIIPTKGFSAQATQCLPHASEIEVETGPYFGGKIVVDGGNCGVKGNPDEPRDKYTMRIDHKECGSLVKPETNTVETFITVQENLGIFTHSTRRFVVVCSFQSGAQTVRASFSVPGKEGVASTSENDSFEPDGDRMSREQRQMRYVDRSALVLKEPSEERSEEAEELADERDGGNSAQMSTTAKEDARDEQHTPNAVATLEDIIQGINERSIKHENDVSGNDLVSVKYDKLVASDSDATSNDSVERVGSSNGWFGHQGDAQGRALFSTIQYISANMGSVVVTIAISVIILIICMFIIYREATQRRQHRHFSRTGSLMRCNSNCSQTMAAVAHRSRPQQLPPPQHCSM